MAAMVIRSNSTTNITGNWYVDGGYSQHTCRTKEMIYCLGTERIDGQELNSRAPGSTKSEALASWFAYHNSLSMNIQPQYAPILRRKFRGFDPSPHRFSWTMWSMWLCLKMRDRVLPFGGHFSGMNKPMMTVANGNEMQSVYQNSLLAMTMISIGFNWYLD